MNSASRKPLWLDLGFYTSKYGQLDPSGWYHELNIRRGAGSEISSLMDENSSFDRDPFWAAFYSSSRSECNSVQPPNISPLVELNYKQAQNTPWDLELEIANSRCLLIDLDASDPALIEAFQTWLKKARSRAPLPVKRRGRPGLNTTITENHYSKWKRYNILAVFDLDFWTKVKNFKYTSSELYFLLKPMVDAEPKEWGREARAALSEAIESIELLRHLARTN